MPEDLDARLTQTKMASAILAACIVQTLAESDATLQKRFLERLERAYHEARDQVDVDCLEVLTWTREILRSDDLSSLLHS